MLLLFVTLFNSILGLSLLFPILAPLGRELGLSELEITSLSTGYALMQFLLSAFWGRTSERRGRKPVLLLGITGFAVGFFGFAAVAELGLEGALSHWPLFGLLLATRLAGGAFSSATLPTGQAYAADISTRENRTGAMAVIGAAFGLGLIFGPAIGAGVAELTGSLLAPVYLSASVAVLNAVFVFFFLPEPERRVAKETPRSRSALVRRVWVLLAVALSVTIAAVAMEQTIAFYFMDRLHLEEADAPEVVGIALFAYGIVAVLAQGFLVRRVRWSPITLMRAGLPIAFAGLVVLVFAHDQATITVALCLQGLGQGLLLPGVTSAFSLAGGDHEQGAVAGLNSAAQGLGRTLGPVVGGGFYEIAWELPYAFSASLLLLVLLVTLALGRFIEHEPPPSPS